MDVDRQRHRQPGRHDADVQRKIVASWVDRLNPGLTSYDDRDEFLIEPETEAQD